MRPVEVDFQVRGIADVQKAFQTVQQAAEKAGRARVQATRRETDTQEKAYQRLVRETTRWEQQRIREAERAEKSRVKSAENENRAIIRTANEAMRAYEKAEQQRLRIRDNSARMAGRIAEREAREEMRAAEKSRHAFSRAIGRGVVGGSRAVASIRGSVVRQMMNVGGGFDIADSVRRRMSESGLAADIANSGFMPEGDKAENRVRRSSSEVLGAARATGVRFGMETPEVLGGLQAFVGKTGDLDAGLKTMEKLASLATATGTSFSDMASAAAEVFNTDTKQSADDLMHTMRQLAGQGKLGAVEIRDEAKRAALITSSAGKFEGDKSSNIAILGALAQEAKARGGAANAAEATTSVARFADDLAKNSDKFAANGIRVKGKGGQLRNAEDVIRDTLTATHGDVSKIGKLFNVRSARAVEGFASIYRSAGGGQAGMAEVNKELERLKNAAMTEAEEKESVARRMEEADKKWEQVMLQLRNAVGDSLLPALIKLIPSVEKAIPQIVDLAQAAGKAATWLADNPFKGAAAVIGVYVGKEIAAAQIGGLIRAAIGGGPTAGGVPVPLPGLAGLAGAALAVGTGMEVVDSAATGAKAGETEADAMFRRIGKLKFGLADKTVSPEEADKQLRKFQASLSYASENSGTAAAALAGVSAPLALVSGGARKDIAAYNKNAQLADHAEDLQRAFKSLRQEIDGASKSLQKIHNSTPPAADPNSPNRNSGAL